MQEEIRAKRFVVVDDDGSERAALGLVGDAVELTMRTTKDDQPTVSIRLDENGDAHLKLTRQGRSAELLVAEHRVSFRLSNEAGKPSSCSMAVDDAGAWVVTEAIPGVGAHMHSKNDGSMTAIWLSEHQLKRDEELLRSRYLRPEPGDDSNSGWVTHS